MKLKNVATAALQAARTGLGSVAIFQLAIGSAFATPPPTTGDNETTSPIKHVIVIIGENRSFDHVFATYVPPKQGESVYNLLSEGIVNADGTPGSNFAKAAQVAGSANAPDAFYAEPDQGPFSRQCSSRAARWRTDGLLYCRRQPGVGEAVRTRTASRLLRLSGDRRNRIAGQDSGYPYQGSFGHCSIQLDAACGTVPADQRRHLHLQRLRCQPGAPLLPDVAAAGLQPSPTRPPIIPPAAHAHLFPWVETTVGAGANGITQPANFSTEYSPDRRDHRRRLDRSWASTTSRMATLPTSRSSPMTTR